MSCMDLLLCAVFIIAGLFLFIIVIGKKYNGADWDHYFINVLDGWIRIYCQKFHRQENQRFQLPENKKLIIASNHESSIDPFLLITATNKPIRFMIAEEEYHRPILHWMFKAAGCIPVNRSGRVDVAFKETLRVINTGELVGIFPQGGIHSADTPKPRIKPGIIKLSELSGCDIFPVRIKGISAPGTMFKCIIKRGHIQFDVNQPITSEQAQNKTFKQGIADWFIGKTDTIII